MTKNGTKQAKVPGAAVEEGLQDLIDSAEELLESLRDQQGEVVEGLRARASATMRSARRRLEALRPDVGELATRSLQSTVSFVRKDPWRALALGAVILLAIGVLANRGDADSD